MAVDPQGKGQFLRVVQPTEKTLCYYCGVRSKTSIMASARLLQPTMLLPTDRCHISFSPWKIRPCDAAASKFLKFSLLVFAIYLLWKSYQSTCTSYVFHRSETYVWLPIAACPAISSPAILYRIFVMSRIFSRPSAEPDENRRPSRLVTGRTDGQRTKTSTARRRTNNSGCWHADQCGGLQRRRRRRYSGFKTRRPQHRAPSKQYAAESCYINFLPVGAERRASRVAWNMI